MARTMILAQLSLLLYYKKLPETKEKEYIKAIRDDNCLGKRYVFDQELHQKLCNTSTYKL